MAFVKLDTGILHSTLWADLILRNVFIAALLMAEPMELKEPINQLEVRSLQETGWVVPPGWYGMVHAAGTGIVRTAQVKHERGMEALEALGSPDTGSRSHEFEGRRMVRINGGYLILNYFKYRDRDYTAAERMRALRARRKEQRYGVTANVRDVHPNVTQAEAEAEAYKSKPLAQRKTLSDAETIYACYPRKVGKGKAIKAIQQAMKRLKAGEYKNRQLTDAEVFAGLKNRTLMFAQSAAGQKASFTPHPATWFNRSSYLDDPKEWNDDQPVDNKAVTRALNNRDAILAGLGYGGNVGTVRPDSGPGFAAGGNAAVGADVLAIESNGAQMGLRGAFADIEILPKAGGNRQPD